MLNEGFDQMRDRIARLEIKLLDLSELIAHLDVEIGCLEIKIKKINDLECEFSGLLLRRVAALERARMPRSSAEALADESIRQSQ